MLRLVCSKHKIHVVGQTCLHIPLMELISNNSALFRASDFELLFTDNLNFINTAAKTER